MSREDVSEIILSELGSLPDTKASVTVDFYRIADNLDATKVVWVWVAFKVQDYNITRLRNSSMRYDYISTSSFA